MSPSLNPYLLAAAAGSLIAALLHLGCIAFGAPWYRAMGAGEGMARLAESGSWRPTLITLAITAMLLVWALFALSGGGAIRPLPLTKPALLAISAVLLVRGLGFVFLQPYFPGNSATFWAVSSGFCLLLGGLHAVGLYQLWSRA
ncbi:MAG: hypothetical protein ACK4F7_07170 [Inhella sp.]